MRGCHDSAVNQTQRICLRPEEDEEAGHTQSLNKHWPPRMLTFYCFLLKKSLILHDLFLIN